jgi:hypothetical protein
LSYIRCLMLLPILFVESFHSQQSPSPFACLCC